MNGIIASIDIPAASAAALGWVSQALLFGTALAVVTWVVTRLMRHRLSSSFEAALWSIVLVKFLIPVGPETSFSLSNVWATLSAHSLGQFAATDPTDIDGSSTSAAATARRPPNVVPAASRPPAWKVPLATAYLTGVLILLVLRLGSYRALVARCRTLPLADDATRDLVREVCRRLGVRRVPSVRLSDEPSAPFVTGFFGPLLVLSHRQLARPDELETVIVHEVTHLRRGDLFVRYLQWITGTLLFFWPVVAWVNRRIDRACEHVCDEWALRHGRLTAGEYARCLLNAMQPQRFHRMVYQPACMAGSYTNIERRITMILESRGRRSTRRAWGLLMPVVLLAWAGFVLSGAAGAAAGDKVGGQDWGTSKEGMTEHINYVIERISQYPAADVDDSGQTSRPERTAFMMAVVMEFPDAVMAEFPYADYDGDGKLSFMETYDFIRGNTLGKMEMQETKLAYKTAVAEHGKGSLAVKKAEDQIKASKISVTHTLLDGLEWLLDEMPGEPAAGRVAQVSAKVNQFEAEQESKNLGEKLAKLRYEVQLLRTKAAEVGGEEAEKYEAKAADLEAKIAAIEAKAGVVKVKKVRG